MTSLHEHPILKELLPYQKNFIEIAGHKMHYLDEGSGPVVVCLHGNPTWCFFYRALIKELKDDFRVIAPDFIGLGLSDHPKNVHFRAIDRINHILELLDRLSIDKFSLVMHDWGGAIGTGVAVRKLDKVQRLVYLNTTLTETESLPPLIKTAASRFIGPYLTKHSNRFIKFATGLGVVNKLPKRVKKAYFLPYQSRQRRQAIWDFVEDIPFDSTHPSYADMLDLAERIPGLADVPVQIVWGLKDPCFHREMLSKVAEHFPQARILELPKASHLIFEDASEQACGAIKKFLTKSEKEVRDSMQRELNGNKRGPANILYQRFLECVQANPDDHAVVIPRFLGDRISYVQWSYRDLNRLINKYQRGLSKLGLKPKHKVLMLVGPGVEFVALSLAVMGRGAIPVYLDPGMGREKLEECINNLQPDVFIGSPKAQLLRLVNKKLFASVKVNIQASDWGIFGGTSLSFLKKFAAKPLPHAKSSGTVLVGYTSGATGTPKGVVYTDKMVESQLKIFQDVFDLKVGGKDLPLLPLFSLFNVSLGVCSVFPPVNPAKPLSLDPSRITNILVEQQITYSFGSPTLWKKIAEYCVRSRKKLTYLEKVFIAGAPVPAETLVLVKSILENGDAYTPYGATEALPVSLISASELSQAKEQPALKGQQGTLVGRPIPQVQLKVVEIASDSQELRECAPYEIGEVIVSGPNVSKSYFELPEITAQSKLNYEDRLWHRMGDMGYIDSAGQLYFCGRKSHVVATSSETFYSVPTERIFNSHKKVARSALVYLKSQDAAAIVVEPYPQYWPEGQEVSNGFLKELAELGASSSVSKSIKYFFFHRSFPVDGRHNAKIFREQLGEWADQQNLDFAQKVA